MTEHPKWFQLFHPIGGVETAGRADGATELQAVSRPHVAAVRRIAETRRRPPRLRRRAKVRLVADVRRVDPIINQWAKPLGSVSEHPAIPRGAALRWARDSLERSPKSVTANDDRYAMDEAAFA